jgi:hypothetical protein
MPLGTPDGGAPPASRDGPHALLRLGGVLAALMLGCGSPNPRILDATEEARPAPAMDDGQLSEAEKIRRLIAVVHDSEDLTFIQSGNERDGPAAAAHLERRLARVPAGVPTARGFVDRVAVGKLRASEPDRVRLGDGTVVEAHSWFLDRLAEIEGRPADHMQKIVVQSPGSGPDDTPRQVGILDALQIVEQSGLVFVAPARRTHSGKRKGKRKEYTASEFAGMLRKKWEFLGADIVELDAFVEQIATDAFASFEPYQVQLADGREREFRGWLLEQLDIRRTALSQGAAP